MAFSFPSIVLGRLKYKKKRKREDGENHGLDNFHVYECCWVQKHSRTVRYVKRLRYAAFGRLPLQGCVARHPYIETL